MTTVNSYKTLTIDLKERSYPIYIGDNLLQQDSLILDHLQGKQMLLVTNQFLADLYLPTLQKKIDSYKDTVNVEYLIIEDGEVNKTLATVEQIVTKLLDKGMSRKVTLVSLGGGVIGDITGFAASIYMRGANFIQIPTTLLSQVDAAVGGKTGVNHPLGKNMIGTFYQPKAVLADTSILKSLPKREFSAGIAEIIKYGLICSENFFTWIEDSLDALFAQQTEALVNAIYQSCVIKADIVAKDEYESGLRAILNFGHTFAHAIEVCLGYGTYLHGEAVAVGMLMAIDLSIRMDWLDKVWYDRLLAVLQRSQLPTTLPKGLCPQELIQAMSRDKKNINQQLRFVLLRSCGEAVISDQVEKKLLLETLVRFTS